VLAEVLDRLKAAVGNYVVAIDGPCCSGKSTLADTIAGNVACNIIRCDDFFLPPGSIRGDFNLDIDRLIGTLRSLPQKEGDSLTYDKYCCKSGTYKKVRLEYKRITIVEGVYSLAPSLRDFYNLTVFVDLDLSERLKRLRVRNPHNYDRFVDEWIPYEDRYLDKYSVRDYADIRLVAK